VDFPDPLTPVTATKVRAELGRDLAQVVLARAVHAHRATGVGLAPLGGTGMLRVPRRYAR
jgi:hypothetical protein